MAEQELRTQLGQLQQHVQQLQEQAQTASALEYRCEGLVKDVQHRDQQIGHLKGEVNCSLKTAPQTDLDSQILVWRRDCRSIAVVPAQGAASGAEPGGGSNQAEL